jgi:hypothetical protein
MLVRKRKSRIYFVRKFFDYPISPDQGQAAESGRIRTVCIGASYAAARCFHTATRSTSSSFSSTATAASCTRPSSSPASRCGACPATRSARNGSQSASRACGSPRPSPTSSRRHYITVGLLLGGLKVSGVGHDGHSRSNARTTNCCASRTQMTLKHETHLCRRFGLKLAVVISDTHKGRELPAITSDLSYAGEAFT